MIENRRLALPAAALALLCVIAGLVASDLAESAQEPPEIRAEIRAESRPLQSRTTEEAPPLCRFGVNASDDIGAYDTSPLRLGWYVNFRATAAGAGPAGADFVPIIRLQQTGPNSYAYTPSGAALLDAIAANPAAVWLIGNEPDRPGPSQDNIEPQLYAAAYHELYQLIKGADAEARVFAGTIVQPTPIRLLYLDMVLESYRESFGEPMPVDGWSIHNFILNEVSCEYDITNCWGAEVPPGIDAPHGEILNVDDHDRMDLFVERIRRFRQWMNDRDYHGLPVYNSEYGILMPPDIGNFPPERVNAFMDNTFDYMMEATDPLLGDPEDGYRLIQKWSWYSNSDTFFNGWLFDPQTKMLSEMGQNYAAYVSGLEADVDLYPSRIFAEPTAPFTQGELLTFTLRATVANSGNAVTSTVPFAVRFYDGDPAGGGTQIGGDQMVSLAGCGDNETVEVTWSDVPAGAHQVYVSVDGDGQIEESDELNNQRSQVILVASERIFLSPAIR